MNPFIRRIPAVVVGVAVIGLLATACGGAEDTPADTDRIREAVGDAVALENRFHDAKNRLTVDCMTEAGFDVHPLDLTTEYAQNLDEQSKAFLGSDAPGLWELPSVDEAKERGLDVGRYNDPDFDWDGYEKEQADDESTAQTDPFYEMDDEYREGYERARYGDEFYDFMYNPESGSESDDVPVEAGCAGQVVEAVTQTAGVDEEGLVWPAALEDWEAQIALYNTETLATAQGEWATCVEDRGHPRFEFTDGSINVWEYVNSFYEDMVDTDTGEDRMYEPPAGAPWEFDEAYEKEVELAVDFAECADETGLRETMQSEWDNAMETIAVENREDIFAWHDRLEEAVNATEALLDG